MADPRPVPLTVAIGESVFALGKRAPGLVRPNALYDNAAVLVTRLVELTIVTDDKPLLLPPTRFAAIEQVAGTITGVKLAPMTSYARLKATDGLARWLMKHVATAGWKVDKATPIDLDALTKEMVESRLPARKTYATFRRGDAQLRLVLEESATRARDMKPPASEPLFLVKTDFVNKPLRDAQTAKLFKLRKEMTGGTQSVLLSAWAGRA